jgi:hypothetical protein
LVFVHIFWRISLLLIVLILIYILIWLLLLIFHVIDIHVKVHRALLHLCLFYTFLYQIKSMVALRVSTFGHLLRRGLLRATFLGFQLFLICLNSFDIAGYSFLVTLGANLSAALGCERCIGLFCFIGTALTI